MKAIIISALLFFSLRAMSDVGESLKGPCPYSTQASRKVGPKIIADSAVKSVVVPTSTKAISK
jgi:hypothetical protein